MSQEMIYRNTFQPSDMNCVGGEHKALNKRSGGFVDLCYTVSRYDALLLGAFCPHPESFMNMFYYLAICIAITRTTMHDCPRVQLRFSVPQPRPKAVAAKLRRRCLAAQAPCGLRLVKPLSCLLDTASLAVGKYKALHTFKGLGAMSIHAMGCNIASQTRTTQRP